MASGPPYLLAGDIGAAIVAGPAGPTGSQGPAGPVAKVAGQTPDGTGNVDLSGQFAPMADSLALARLERQARQRIDSYNRRCGTRYTDATVATESWVNTAAWGGTASVAGGKMFGSSNGLALGISVPAGARRLYRSMLHVANAASQYAFIGVSADTAGAAPSGSLNNLLLLGVQASKSQVYFGSNLTGSVSNPAVNVPITATDYVATLAIDETTVSLSLAPVGVPQGVLSISILRSQMPGGAVNNLVLSNSDGASGMTWGPVVQVSDLCPPPPAAQSPGGVALFGASNPITFNRTDPTTGIRHLVTLPGNYDPRQPAPVVLYMHEALIGNAAQPYLDSRWTNVLAAFLAAGYILVSSDNGSSPSGADPFGTGAVPTAAQVPLWDDQFGNQRGLNDYAAAVEWTRQHFNTGALLLLGLSQGGEFVQNVLASRAANALGNIAAAASISPSTDLVAVSNLSAYQAAVWAVWGATSAATFAAAITGYNPVAQPVPKLRGVPQRFYVALDDTTTPKATHVDPMVAALAGTTPEASVVTVASGGHLAPALYQGADLVAFFSKYA